MSNIVQLNVTQAEQPLPEFTMPSNITTMTDEELDAFLDGIRARRMVKLVLYSETLQLKEEADKLKMQAQYARIMERFAKQISAVDKSLEKLDLLANQVRAMRLQLGADPML